MTAFAEGTFRIIVLGAGFSAPAGLPLGADLFKAVRHDISALQGHDNWFERDLARFTEYRQAIGECHGVPDLEEFIGFLDTEHYLGLKGKDTWSDEGNETQLVIRNSIARVLYERTPTSPGDIPAVYRQFARQVTTTDCILTFNYDLLLEAALEAEGVPFRRFPHRYASAGWSSNTISDKRQELVLLKMHGSIDWFDHSQFVRRSAAAARAPVPFDAASHTAPIRIARRHRVSNDAGRASSHCECGAVLGMRDRIRSFRSTRTAGYRQGDHPDCPEPAGFGGERPGRCASRPA